MGVSRDLKDRVARHVTLDENYMASTEDNQSASETILSAAEKAMAARELTTADEQHKDTILP